MHDQRSENRDQGSGWSEWCECRSLARHVCATGSLEYAQARRPWACAAAVCWPAAAQDMQDQPKMIPQRGIGFLRRSSRCASAGAEHGGARTTARRQLLLYGRGTGSERLPRRAEPDAVSGDDGSAQARAGAIQHLLHAVPLARGQRAGRDCAARLQAGGESSRPGAAVAAALALLLCDDARLRRHAGLLGAIDAGGSLGGGGIHPRAAVEPGGNGGRMCRRACRSGI